MFRKVLIGSSVGFTSYPLAAGPSSCVPFDVKNAGEAGIATAVTELVGYLNSHDAAKIHERFFAQVKRANPLDAFQVSMQRFDETLGKDWKVNSLRGWQVKREENPWASCGEEMEILSHCGVERQLAILAQVSGSLAKGELFLSLIPEQGVWQITAFQVLQRTHLDRDAKAWLARSEQPVDWAQDFIGRHMAILLSKDFTHLRLPSTIVVSDLQKSSDEALAKVKALMGTEYTVDSLDIMLVSGGVGLIVRFIVQNDSGSEHRKLCEAASQRLGSLSGPERFKGVKCVYLRTLDVKAKQGPLGSFYKEF